MKEAPSIFLNMAIRFVIAGVLLWLAWTRLAGLSILFFPFVILASAIIVAPPFARLIGLPAGALFFPNAHFDKPQPVYGIPEARRKERAFEEALDGYRAITSAHPQELKAWMATIEIALLDLNDRTRADAFFALGVQSLTGESERARLATWRDTLVKHQESQRQNNS